MRTGTLPRLIVVRHFLLLLTFWVILLPPMLHAQSEKENADFKLAVSLYTNGMFDLAEAQFKNFVSTYGTTSQTIEARFYLGLAQLKLRKFDDARTTFQNFALAYVEHPKAPEAWFNVGEAFQALGNEREAGAAYERVRVFHPKSPLAPDGLLKAGELYRRIGDRENAKRTLRSLIQDYPNSPSVLQARLAIGELYADEGQTALAEREARRVSESDAPAPVRAAALFSIGKLQARASLFADAEATFSAVIKSYKDVPAALRAEYELAEVNILTGKPSAAIEHLKKVIDRAEDDSLKTETLAALGRAYLRAGQYAPARKTFDQLFAAMPDAPLSARCRILAARAAIEHKEIAHASIILTPVLSSRDSLIRRTSLVLAAEAALGANRARDAEVFYQTAIREFPVDVHTGELLLRLARVYQEGDRDFRRAMGAYDELAERFPGSRYGPVALAGIAKCQERLGETGGAIKAYTDLQSLYPANDSSAQIQERIDFLRDRQLKDRDAGIQKLARLMGEVLSGKPGGSLSLQLGDIYFNELKDFSSAAQQFESALTQKLDPEQAQHALLFKARALQFLSADDSSRRNEAGEAYTALLRQAPEGTAGDEAAYGLLRLSFTRMNCQQKLAAGSAFLVGHPNSQYRTNLLLMLGDCAASLGQWQISADYYREVLQLGAGPGEIGISGIGLEKAYRMLLMPDSAILACRRVIDRPVVDRRTVEGLWNLAERFRERGDLAGAIPLWRRIVSEFGYTSYLHDSYALLSESLVASGEADEAIANYEREHARIQSSPFGEEISGDYWMLLGKAYEKKGDRQRALSSYHRFLHTAGANGGKAMEVFYTLGSLARAEGQIEHAAAYFRQASNLGGESSVSRDVADLLFQSEQYQEASRQYGALANSTKDGDLRRLFQSRAIISLLRLDRIDEAQIRIEEFRKNFAKARTDLAQLEYERGLSLYRKQNFPLARKVLERVAEDDSETPSGPWAAYYLGKIDEASNKLAEAAKRYEATLKNFPSSDVIPRVLLSLGNMHFNAERYEESIRYYQRITDAPGKAEDILPYAMNNLIQAYESTKLYDNALRMTRDFIERYPNDESILDKKIKAGTLLTQLGYYDQAVNQLQSLINEAGALLEAELRYDIGEAYYYKGDYQQAILEFLKVPYLTSRQGKVDWTATSFYMAGQSYEKMSKPEEAANMYQQIIDRPGIDATFKAAARKEIDRVNTLIRKGRK